MRKLETKDAGFIIACLLQMADESPVYADATQNCHYVWSRLTDLISSDQMFGVVIDDIGFMLGNTGSTWYTPDIMAYEMLLYVLPAFRGQLHAVRMIQEFERMAKNRGAVEVRCGATANMDDQRVLRLYEALGYERLGTGVRKRI